MGTILVVDDSVPARYSTARILTAAGFDVREAGTGRDALRLAHLANLILLDVALPDIDGFEVCAQLKRDVTTRHTPVIYKTAIYRDDEHRHRGLALGAEDYLTEPIEPGALIRCVRRVLEPRARTGADNGVEALTTRAAQTRDKMQRGGLPAPLSARPTIVAADGEACSGCGEPKALGEVQYQVVWGGAVTFSFHEECYRAWSTFGAR